MKSTDISRILAKTLFNYRRFICVENVSWGMLPWEADMLACSQSGYLYEIEIKVSVSDLKRDPLKNKWRLRGLNSHNLRGMWYAMPDGVWAHPAASACVPDFAGVIVVSPGAGAISRQVRVVKPCRPDPSARPVSEVERYQLARLGVMRYWTRKEAA